MGSTETESRFGDKAATADGLELGGVAWRDGTAPVLVVGVTRADDGDDAAVQVAALDVETVHVNDLATEYVDPAEPVTGGGGGAVPAPAPGAMAAAVPTAQPPADDPGRQTTPTGALAGAGSATVDAAAAQAAASGEVDTTNPPPGVVPGQSDREAEQERRIAALEARNAELETQAAGAPPHRPATIPPA